METLKRLPVLAESWPVLLNNLFNRDSFKEGNLDFFDQNRLVPAVNIKEDARAFGIEMLAPGLAKEDFKIEVDKNILTISAEKTATEKSEEAHYHRKEFSFQSLKRSFTLPENVVDTEKIVAQYTDGILRLSLPKKEEALPKPARLISIS